MAAQKLRSVLYVDDDPDICAVVQATLRLIAGLTVHTADSGELAIDLAYELRPNLIMMDVMMPGLDGPSTLRRIRNSALIRDIPVVFLTAKVLPTEVAQFLDLGAIGVIGKPFDPVRLCDDILTLWNSEGVAPGEVLEPDDPAAVQTQVSMLTQSFLLRARGDVVRLRQILTHAAHGEPSDLEEVKRVAHSLHGTAAMFGFSALSASGGEIERLAGSASMNESAVLNQLMDLTECLAREVELAGRLTLVAAGSLAQIAAI